MCLTEFVKCIGIVNFVVTLNQIQETSRTRISFKGDRNADKDKDRILVIRGTQEGIHQAELMVRKIIVDQPPIIADVLTVPCEAIGRIIG